MPFCARTPFDGAFRKLPALHAILRYAFIPLAMAGSSLIGSPLGAQPTPRDSAMAAIDAFLRATNTNDAEGMRMVMHPEGQFFYTRYDTTQFIMRRVLNADWVERIRRNTDSFLERIWNPTVVVEGRIATVITPYDFFVNRKFTHCGVNMFSLLRTEARWQIVSLVYTIQRDGCQPSPLGPPF